MRWVSVNPPSERREQVYWCISILQKMSIGTVSNISVSVFLDFFIFLFVYIFSVNTLLALFILKNAIE